MIEIDDYNSEYFFEGENELEEYHSILDSSDYYSPNDDDRDFSYNIFTLEQANNVLNELGNKNVDLGVAAHSATNAINHFIKIYTESQEKR